MWKQVSESGSHHQPHRQNKGSHAANAPQSVFLPFKIKETPQSGFQLSYCPIASRLKTFNFSVNSDLLKINYIRKHSYLPKILFVNIRLLNYFAIFNRSDEFCLLTN